MQRARPADAVLPAASSCSCCTRPCTQSRLEGQQGAALPGLVSPRAAHCHRLACSRSTALLYAAHLGSICSSCPTRACEQAYPSGSARAHASRQPVPQPRIQGSCPAQGVHGMSTKAALRPVPRPKARAVQGAPCCLRSRCATSHTRHSRGRASALTLCSVAAARLCACAGGTGTCTCTCALCSVSHSLHSTAGAGSVLWARC